MNPCPSPASGRKSGLLDKAAVRTDYLPDISAASS
jgi:hypothetical protein